MSTHMSAHMRNCKYERKYEHKYKVLETVRNLSELVRAQSSPHTSISTWMRVVRVGSWEVEMEFGRVSLG